MQNDGFRGSEQILGNNAESGLGKFFFVPVNSVLAANNIE